MDFKKPSKTSAIDTAVTVLGGAGGAMLSRAAFATLDTPSTTTGTDFARIGKRVGIIAVLGFIAASATGKDSLTTGIKGAAIGGAIVQGIDLVADFATKSNAALNLTTSEKKFDKALASAMGLKCPCNSEIGLAKPRRRSSRLRMPEVEIPTLLGIENASSGNTLDALLAKGKSAA